MKIIIIPVSLVSWAQGATLKIGVYNNDPTAIQPVVSLCNSNAVQVRDDGNMDLCLTINPIIDNKSSKSYNCEGLPVFVTGNGRFKLEEAGNSCMSRLRAYANSAGISLNRPIEFGYSVDNDPSGQHAMMATVSIDLKWLQQNKPFMLRAVGNASVSSLSLLVGAACILFQLF